MKGCKSKILSDFSVFDFDIPKSTSFGILPEKNLIISQL